MKCSNAPDGCLYDGDVLNQCSCTKFCACATCPDCTIVEDGRLTCKACQSLNEIEKQARKMSKPL